MNNSGAGNINESFVLDNLPILGDQNILLKKPTSFGDSYYIVESNCSHKCNIPIDWDTPLNVAHKNMQRDNDKNTNSQYPKNITVTQDVSTNTSKRVTVTQDASNSASNRFDDCCYCCCFLYFDLAWNSSINKYSLIKAKLQLQNNDPNIQTKNKNDLKYFLYYNYKIFV